MNDPTPTSAFDTTLTSRYECKYLVDDATAHRVRAYLASHAALDPYSARSETGRYRVYSLYLDSPGLRLYRDTLQGLRNRYKLRLRYYTEDLDGPVFLEVKKRSDVIVRKSRERVAGPSANDFLLSGSRPEDQPWGDDAREFFERCRECAARPALRIRYRREAWESRGVDPVRITFDTQVEHCLLSDPGLVETRPDWRPTPIAGHVILEVKFTDLRPHWLNELVHRFQLDKVSVAKYAESLDCVHRDGLATLLRARLGATRAAEVSDEP